MHKRKDSSLVQIPLVHNAQHGEFSVRMSYVFLVRLQRDFFVLLFMCLIFTMLAMHRHREGNHLGSSLVVYNMCCASCSEKYGACVHTRQFCCHRLLDTNAKYACDAKFLWYNQPTILCHKQGAQLSLYENKNTHFLDVYVDLQESCHQPPIHHSYAST